jgi:drug/metabolite transporter (DMT)-like permease
MISWLLIIILAYFFFSLANLGDKLVLAGQPRPRPYTFFVGLLSGLVFFVIPFVNPGYPDSIALFWIGFSAITYLAGLYTMYSALEKFDVSRVMTTIGATQPVFVLILGWFFFGATVMSKTSILAFILLLAGSVIISFEKTQKATGKYLMITLFSSLIFSFNYIFQKIVFLKTGFWQGFIWIGILTFLFALFFLIGRRNREEIFAKRGVLSRKTWPIFIFSQTSGGVANILQAVAIFLAPVAFLPIVNSLRGIQYVFLFLLVMFLSIFFPKILKEKISKKIIIQKTTSIILIVAGLALLVI